MKVCSVCRRCYEDSVLSCSEENHEPLTEGRAGGCEIIGNYRLDFLHESSMMGETYRAIETTLNKSYLIKILAPELFDSKQKEQFLRETQDLSAIIHPNVARVFESGVLADGSVYVVTEFFTAQTLRDCLTNVGAPSEVTALTITRQAAEGLEAIHSVGTLHRNIKPESIILTSDAENRFLIKLQNIDFGGIHQQFVISRAEQNLPDLRYFSPEQCAAEEVDAQTDVYSLGIVLYEALAGRPPFDAPYADALIYKQINEPPPPVSIHSFDIRMLLTHTLTDVLQKTTRLRLKTANAMSRRIRHIEQLATHSPTPPPAMSYPATMDKSAIVFTPPAKIKNPPPIEELPVVEIAAPTEKYLFFETAVTTENPPVTEITVLTENPPVMETMASIENQTVIETPALPENQTVIEATALPENQTVVENPALIETLPSIDIAAPTENQIIAEKSELLGPVYPDLTTTKLPPLESIITHLPENNLKTREFTPFEIKAEVPETRASKEPVLVQWEQPDDLPSMRLTLKPKKKETFETPPAVEPVLETSFFDDEDSIIDAGEIDSPPDPVLEPEEVHRDYKAERPVFSYDDSGRSWNLPDKRKILMGAGVVALLVLTIGGTLLTRQFQLARDTQQATTQPSPADKPMTKVAEPDKLAEKDKPSTVKPEEVSVSNPTPNSDLPDMSDLRSIDEKPTAPASQPRIKKQPLKEAPQNRSGAVENKTVLNEAPPENKKMEPKVVLRDKKGAIRGIPSKSTNSDTLTRPRIVRNPK